MTVSSTKAYRSREKLRDGRVLNVRPISTSDKDAIIEGFEQLSSESRYFRFFQHKKYISDSELQQITEIDFVNHMALVASITINQKEEFAGVGRYIVVEGDENADKIAEISFTVKDNYQGLGIATILLKHLAVIARENQIDYFLAEVLVKNYKMLDVFENCGLPMKKRSKGTETEVLLQLF